MTRIIPETRDTPAPPEIEQECAAISPYRAARLALLTATAMEVSASAYGAAVWFLPLLRHAPWLPASAAPDPDASP